MKWSDTKWGVWAEEDCDAEKDLNRGSLASSHPCARNLNQASEYDDEKSRVRFHEELALKPREGLEVMIFRHDLSHHH